MTVRIGVLGAARIAPNAIVKPGRRVDGTEVAAVAARDPDRAETFAREHGIAKVHDSYDDLLADPDIDAVYNPLPNGLHGPWTERALAAGKHVLCEKPFTSNADEAEQVAVRAAAHPNLVVMEAFHYRYHPFTERLRRLADGELGTLRRVEAWFCAPLLDDSDIRYRLDLAGGALMDLGCYPLHLLRTLVGEEPDVVEAAAKERTPGLDRALKAELRFPSGVTGWLNCSMRSSSLLGIGARIIADGGEAKVFNFVQPGLLGRVRVRRTGERWGRTERALRRPTYAFQLEAFRDAIVLGLPTLTGPDDAVATMRAIDAIYRAAGLEPRPDTAL
jgi:predicted dehydrogenase